jgi:hypothetical protein
LLGRGINRNRVGDPGRAGIAAIGSLVSRGYDGGLTGRVVSDDPVKRRRKITCGRGILNAAGAVEHPHGYAHCLFRDAVRGAADRASHVRAVIVAVARVRGPRQVIAHLEPPVNCLCVGRMPESTMYAVTLSPVVS